MACEEQKAAQAGERLVIHDSPLLLEKHQEADYRAVVVVLARREDRLARVMRDRGKDRAYVESIMAAQVTDRERIRRADRLVLNTAGRVTLAGRARHALEAILAGLEESALR